VQAGSRGGRLPAGQDAVAALSSPSWCGVVWSLESGREGRKGRRRRGGRRVKRNGGGAGGGREEEAGAGAGLDGVFFSLPVPPRGA